MQFDSSLVPEPDLLDETAALAQPELFDQPESEIPDVAATLASPEIFEPQVSVNNDLSRQSPVDDDHNRDEDVQSNDGIFDVSSTRFSKELDDTDAVDGVDEEEQEYERLLHSEHTDDDEDTTPFLHPYEGEVEEDAESAVSNDQDDEAMDEGSADDSDQDADRARDDGLEDDDFIEVYETAAKVGRRGTSRFEDIVRQRLEADHRNLFHPFESDAEFEVVKWLNTLPLTKIDEFLKLQYITRRCSFSFGSGKTMRKRLDHMPPPRMRWEEVEVKPLSGTTTAPVFLCYRDPMDAVSSLLDRPDLAEHITYKPTRHWRDRTTGTRRYTEILTGDWAWRVQASLPPGGTLLPIILGSDKAHLTQYSGNKSAWPLYLSLGNINSRIRNKPSHRCWILIAYIPIPQFTDSKSIHTVLQHRLFHQCVEIVLKSVRIAGRCGQVLHDSLGDPRTCYPRIAAYLADYPEQTMINLAVSNASPVTTAGYYELGDATQAPARTREYILARLAELAESVDPSDVEAYQKAAKKVGLSGVHRPFWIDLPDYEPDIATCPDILHGLLRFYRDHILKWCIELVGTNELNRRLDALQPITNLRHFRGGIAHLSQWTGREDRELMRILLAVIANAPKITPRIMRCLRNFHDFAYLAQYRSHSTTTLGYLKKALIVFHTLKRDFITSGARRGKKEVLNHFRIPKLCALHNYASHVPQMGTSMQFSTEITETCHQAMAKTAYKATNRKSFFKQMCAYLNRDATVALMVDLRCFVYEQARRRAIRLPGQYERGLCHYLDQVRTKVEKEQKLATVKEKRSKVKYLSVTVTPDLRGVTIADVVKYYCFRTFSERLASFLGHSEQSATHFTLKLDCWYRCKIQRPTVQDEEELADRRTVLAVPPAVEQNKYGRCNCVLLDGRQEGAPSTGIRGCRVAQIRLIFVPRLPSGHPFAGVPLAYVYPFESIPRQATRDIGMFRVAYARGDQDRRIGEIVPLASVARLLQLIPDYGHQMNRDLTHINSMDVWSNYYINSFMDKETYHSVW